MNNQNNYLEDEVMEYTVEKVMEVLKNDSNKECSNILGIYDEYEGEADILDCQKAYKMGADLGITEPALIVEIVTFCEHYKIEPYQAQKCMDTDYILFSEEMDKIVKLVNEENYNIDEAIEKIKSHCEAFNKLSKHDIYEIDNAAKRIIGAFKLEIPKSEMIERLVPICQKHNIKRYVDICEDKASMGCIYNGEYFEELCAIYEHTNVSFDNLDEYHAISSSIGCDDPDILENVLMISRIIDEGFEDYKIYDTIYKLSLIYDDTDYRTIYKYYKKTLKKLNKSR